MGRGKHPADQALMADGIVVDRVAAPAPDDPIRADVAYAMHQDPAEVVGERPDLADAGPVGTVDLDGRAGFDDPSHARASDW